MYLVKTLLGVRKTTSNDACLVELALPTAKAFVQNTQVKYFKRIMDARVGVADDPLNFTLELYRNARTPCWKYLNSVLEKRDIFVNDLNETKGRLRDAGPTQTKLRTYVELNPNLEVSKIYSDRDVNELERIKVSRLRLSSHDLAIEKGRWSRTPRERRLCSCGLVQTEEHVICECDLTAACRRREYLSLSEFFEENPVTICNVVNLSLSTLGV